MNEILNIMNKKIKVKKYENVYAAYQIPYAKSNGRFNTTCPLNLKDLPEYIDCSSRGPVFPQNPNRLSKVMGHVNNERYQSETAFHLNIFSSNDFIKKPVLFWIHGGGWLTGGGSLPWYDGMNLVKQQDIIVVTINYRLGVLGSFYQEKKSTNNFGMSDILQALKWVYKHIDAFGGDPERITVGGQSAGAWYTVALLGNDYATKLFKSAVLASFPGNIAPLNKKYAQQLSIKLKNYLRPKTIYSATTEEILIAQDKVMLNISKNNSNVIPTTFIPIESKEYLSRNMIEQAAIISGGRINVMAWITKDEINAFMPENEKNIDTQKATIEVFKKPTLNLLNHFDRKGSQTFFDVIKGGNAKLGAPHCYDLPLLFGNFENWENAPMLKNIKTDSVKQASYNLQSHLVQFMKKY